MEAAAAEGDTPRADLELSRTRSVLRDTRLRLLQADQQRQALLNSRSWQLTAPLRRMSHLLPTATKAGWLALKGLRWALRGELPARVRAWRRPEPPPPRPTAAASPMLTEPAWQPPRRHILVADFGVPQANRDAGSRANLAALGVLRDCGWAVSFWANDMMDAGEHTRCLEALGIQVLDFRLAGGLQSWLATNGPRLSHVLLMRPELSYRLLPLVLRHTTAPISYYGHDIHSLRIRQEAEHRRDPDLADRAERMLAIERAVWRVVDAVLYFSSTEVDAVRALEPGVVAHAVPLYGYENFACRDRPPSTNTILFVGGYLHCPNEDAAVWLAQEIMPLIRARHPGARLVLAGADPPAVVRALADETITVTGRISDAGLAELYDTARVIAAPLRFGAGVKGKVVEALREGVPVVTTAVGAQGLHELETIVPVRDDAAPFAEAVIKLMEDDDAWMRQSVAQTDYARANFSVDSLRRALLAVVEPTRNATATPA